jgi:hypothetical protein
MHLKNKYKIISCFFKTLKSPHKLANSTLTLIGPGEVKGDLADFDLKLRKNLLSNLIFF